MRKVFFVLTFLLTFYLNADQNTNAVKRDQFQKLISFNATAYYKLMNFCHEKGYKFCKIIKLQYEDEGGLKMQVNGVCKDKTGDIIKDSDILSLSDEKCSFEIICYKNTPKDESCCDVENYFQLIKLYQDQNAQNNEPLKENNSSQVVEIKNLQELKKHITTSSDNPIFVDCYGSSCPPCKMLMPYYEKYSVENAANAKFLKVNIDLAKDISETYQIQTVPTLLIFKKDGLKDKKIGLPEIVKYLNAFKTEELSKKSN